MAQASATVTAKSAGDEGYAVYSQYVNREKSMFDYIFSKLQDFDLKLALKVDAADMYTKVEVDKEILKLQGADAKLKEEIEALKKEMTDLDNKTDGKLKKQDDKIDKLVLEIKSQLADIDKKTDGKIQKQGDKIDKLILEIKSQLADIDKKTDAKLKKEDEKIDKLILEIKSQLDGIRGSNDKTIDELKKADAAMKADLTMYKVTVDARMKESDQKLHDLRGEINKLGEADAALEGELKAYITKTDVTLHDLRGELNKLAEEDANLEGKLNALATALKDMDSQMDKRFARLQGEIDGILERLKALEKDMSDFKNALAKLQADIEKQKQDDAALQSELAEFKEKIETIIKTIEKEIKLLIEEVKNDHGKRHDGHDDQLLKLLKAHEDLLLALERHKGHHDGKLTEAEKNLRMLLIQMEKDHGKRHDGHDDNLEKLLKADADLILKFTEMNANMMDKLQEGLDKKADKTAVFFPYEQDVIAYFQNFWSSRFSVASSSSFSSSSMASSSFFASPYLQYGSRPSQEAAAPSEPRIDYLNVDFAVDPDHVKKSFKQLLKLTPSCLKGIADHSDAPFTKLYMPTIEKLGTSKYFLRSRAMIVLSEYEELAEPTSSTKLNIDNALVEQHRSKLLAQIVKLPPSALLGLSEKVDADFKQLKPAIKTIQDMGSWKFFKWAQAMYTMSEQESNERLKSDPELFETPPKKARTAPALKMNVNNMIEKDLHGKMLQSYVKEKPSAFQGMTEGHDAILNVLGIKSIEELAKNKHFRLASAINEVAFLGGKRNQVMNVDEVVDKAFEGTCLHTILEGPPSALNGLAGHADATLQEVYPAITTVQELGSYKFAEWANAMFTLAQGEA